MLDHEKTANAIEGEFSEHSDMLSMDFPGGGRAAALFSIDVFVEQMALAG